MKNYLDQALVFLDTETTRLDTDAQIIEVAIIDGSRDVLLDQRLKPSLPIEERAQVVHGISLAILLIVLNDQRLSQRFKRP